MSGILDQGLNVGQTLGLQVIIGNFSSKHEGIHTNIQHTQEMVRSRDSTGYRIRCSKSNPVFQYSPAMTSALSSSTVHWRFDLVTFTNAWQPHFRNGSIPKPSMLFYTVFPPLPLIIAASFNTAFQTLSLSITFNAFLIDYPSTPFFNVLRITTLYQRTQRVGLLLLT